MIFVILSAVIFTNIVLLEHKDVQLADTKDCKVDLNSQNLKVNYQLLSNEVLTILNSDIGLQDMIEGVIGLIQSETNISAVGIRIKKDDDFPYFAQKGLAKSFLKSENSILAIDKKGNICVDKLGNPKLECTCGLVISGKIDTSHPLFTKAGSFVTNNSFPILDIPSKDFLKKKSNACKEMQKSTRAKTKSASNSLTPATLLMV